VGYFSPPNGLDPARACLRRIPGMRFSTLSVARFSITERRKFIKAGESELLQKFECRSIDDRPAGLFQPALFLNETSMNEGAEYAVRIHTAHCLDVAARHWLAVGDNRKGFQCGGRQFSSEVETQKAAYPVRSFRGSDHLNPLPFALQSQSSAGILGAQLGNRLVDLVWAGFQNRGQAIHRNRFTGHEQHAFNQQFDGQVRPFFLFITLFAIHQLRFAPQSVLCYNANGF
jgi:hypothetical protein